MREKLWNHKLHLSAILLASAAALCFPQLLHQEESMLGYTSSIFSVMVWGVCYCLLRQSLDVLDLHDRRGWLLAGVPSLFFTVAMLFGGRLDTAENVDFSDGMLWVSIPVFTCLFAVCVRRLWDALLAAAEKRENAAYPSALSRYLPSGEAGKNLLVFGVLLLCWGIVFLAVYPGFFVYDAQEEYLQVAARSFTTHHPLLHVLLLGGMICMVHKLTGSYNLGIACYTLLQMLVLAGVFTFVISYLRRKGAPVWLRVVSVLYFAVFPVVVMFALCSSKDALFTASLLLLLVALLELGYEEAHFFASVRWRLLLVCSAVGMMLFRKNGVYAFLVMIPFLLLWERRRKFHHPGKQYGKKLFGLLGISLAGYFVINAALGAVFHAQAGENQEILTVPIQQLARTYRYSPEVFSQEEKELLWKVLPEEVLERYRPRLSDPVKYYFNNQEYEAHKAEYGKLWLQVGLRKPLTYLNAWLMTSYGFWYPDTVINVYAGNSVFTFTYEDCSYFGYEVEEPGSRESRVPWLDEVYRKLSLEIWQEKIPVVSMLFSPGFLFWVYVFGAFYALYRQKYQALPFYLLIFLVWLTVILGPTYLPRYVLIFWYGLPLLIAQLGCKNRGSVIY